MTNVLIFGGRDFKDYDLLKEKCDAILASISDEITVISGKASGADKLGEDYADEKKYSKRYFPAKWDDLNAIPCRIKHNKYGKPYNVLAGFNSDSAMVKEADIAIGFWNGKSTGTKDSINLCKKKGITLEVIMY